MSNPRFTIVFANACSFVIAGCVVQAIPFTVSHISRDSVSAFRHHLAICVALFDSGMYESFVNAATSLHARILAIVHNISGAF